jgi:hypothetical protein
MIVRISGTGQFDLENEAVDRLHQLDAELTKVMDARDETRFHEVLSSIINLVQNEGEPLSHDTVVPSDVIVPPEDITLDEAHGFFTDEGLLHPVPA